MFQLDWWLLRRLGNLRYPFIVAHFERKLTAWESFQLWVIEKLMDIVEYPRSIVMMHHLKKQLKKSRKNLKQIKALEKKLNKELSK